ncbi:MAG: C-terminal binding protein [Actinomycetota bacterium]|nr:C-terminal binding protein [Actinomycetota bacterium]
MNDNRFKVVFTDYDFEDVAIEKEVLSQMDCDIVELQSKDEDKLTAECADADGLIVQYAPISDKVIAAMQKCKVISRYGIGVDTINLSAATQKGIKVCNVPDYCLDEVADHSLALIMSLGRKIVDLTKAVKSGVWDAVGTSKPVFNFKRQILGIIGFGKIPQNLYPKVKALFGKVLIYDPYVSQEIKDQFGLEMASFYEIIHNSDFLSIYCPLNDSTFHMFDQREFQMMKPTSFIVNTSRGGIINTEALYLALIHGHIAGAGLDVLEQEPPGIDNELVKLDNVIVTPHAAFYSESSIEDLKYKTALNIVKVLKDDNPQNVVNR